MRHDQMMSLLRQIDDHFRRLRNCLFLLFHIVAQCVSAKGDHNLFLFHGFLLFRL